MAAGTIDRQAENALPVCSIESLSEVNRLNLFQFAGEIASRTQRVRIVGSQLVAGQHLFDHLVVRFVGVERFDDPVSPTPNVGLTELTS